MYFDQAVAEDQITLTGINEDIVLVELQQRYNSLVVGGGIPVAQQLLVKRCTLQRVEVKHSLW